MKTTLSLCFVVCALAACQSETPPPEDSSVFGPRDIQSRTDGQQLPDLPPPDISNDRDLASCRMGDYRPCECSPGELGIQRCINGRIEMTCRCGDAAVEDDAGPMDATSDTPPDTAADVAPADATAGPMDAAQGGG